MSFTDALARVDQIQQLTGMVSTPAVAAPAQPDAVERRVDTPSFSTALQQASAPAPAVAAAQPSSSAGARALAWAQSQVGQSEQPPGSNDGPAIATYRSAVAGAAPGQPWCAYFASWAASQAGSPLGDSGQGIGYVDGIRDWASRTGRLVPGASTPAPGDLILFGSRHVGIVESVAADGTITTVEGNEGDAVTRRTRQPGEATDFVRL